MVEEKNHATIELERVLVWRFERLTEAGYTVQQAIDLSAETDVDLHEAIDLVRRGCPTHLAIAILA
jgi:hypothetical protein